MVGCTQVGAPDRQVVVAVQVEVGTPEREPELVASTRHAADRRGPGDELVGKAVDAAAAPEVDLDRPRVDDSADVLEWNADHQVIARVAVDVAGGERSAELVALLR